jgi:acetyl esterase/lipase
MRPFPRLLIFCLALAGALLPATAIAASRKGHPVPPQETGFLNRSIELHGITYRFQVYLPEEWQRDDHKQWPMILFLHGRGERGSEGMWQTQIGLPEQLRDHPERWPFVIVMPQCPQGHYWTDPVSQELALSALDRETAEFHGDPDRTYLTGLSLGGYGAWELARLNPHRWAAVAIVAGGVFWSYAPERWKLSSILPGEYARALGHTSLWLFHGTDDPVVAPRQSEMMYEAVRSAGGRVRLWLYQGMQHDCWTRAYNEPELPRWLLAHHLDSPPPVTAGHVPPKPPEPPPFAERLLIPPHPPAIHLTAAQVDNLVGEYIDANGVLAITLIFQGERLYGRDRYNQISEFGAASPTELFYLNGFSFTRLLAQRDIEGRITGIIFRDDRHEERWEKRKEAAAR